MKNIKHPTEIDKLSKSKSKSTSTKISDREIQEKILENLRNIRTSNNK